MKRRIHLQENGTDFWVTVQRDGDELTVQRDREVYTVSVLDVERIDERPDSSGRAASMPAPAAPGAPAAAPRPAGAGAGAGAGAAGAGGGAISAPMTGVIKEVLVSEGDSLDPGERVILMEAMKMDIEVNAASAGKVAKVLVSTGDSVREGQALIEVG